MMRFGGREEEPKWAKVGKSCDAQREKEEQSSARTLDLQKSRQVERFADQGMSSPLDNGTFSVPFVTLVKQRWTKETPTQCRLIHLAFAGCL